MRHFTANISEVREKIMWKTVIFLLILVPHLCSSDCGKSSTPSLKDKIVGGRDALSGEFPWQASLQRKTRLGFMHICGASLIAPEWLVTAAHCIEKFLTSDYRVSIGTNDLLGITSDQVYSIKMIVIKQGFDEHNFSNDIALIQLFRSVPDFISPICLSEEVPEANSSAIVTGWGATSDGGRASPILQAAEVLIISNPDCLSYYEELSESMMCAGYDEGGIDACQGDSGGPLMQWQGETAYLVGIVSWGAGCAEPHLPGVYTDAVQFVPWIRHYIDPEDDILQLF